MSWVAEALLNIHNWWNSVPQVKLSLEKSSSPVRIGILSAAAINYCGIIDPVQTHPDAVITAIAARSLSRAQDQINKYKLNGAKAYGSYDELLSDSSIDAIYIPLPNGLHAEWALRAMKAGKHVLIEKPLASNASQVKEIQECSKSTGKVALEAYHWLFHPAAHRVKEIIESGQYGALVGAETTFTIPYGVFKSDDIRFSYSLAGGSSMDLAYVTSAVFHFASGHDVLSTRTEVLEAHPRLCQHDKQVDESMSAKLSISGPDSSKPAVICTTMADLSQPKLWGIIPRFWDAQPSIKLEMEKATILFTNFVGPWLSHNIMIIDKATGQKKSEKVYKDGPLWGSVGEPWWTTYRYQLEAFIGSVKERMGGPVYEGPWVSLDTSYKIMEAVDAVYEKAQLPRRGL